MAEWMPLYEIKQQYINAIDEETGEILLSEEEFEKLMESEKMAMEYFIRLYKNKMAYVKALKDEEDALKARRDKVKKSADSIFAKIEKHLNGDKYECGSGVISWKIGNSAVQTDENAFMHWESRFLYGNSEFKPDKNAIKKAIAEGTKIPGWEVQQNNNMSIK